MGMEIKGKVGTIAEFENIAPCGMERGAEDSDSGGGLVRVPSQAKVFAVSVWEY